MEAKTKKKRILANMKFIGNLFLRQLLSTRVVSSVLQELTLCDRADEVPDAHRLECACELLANVGYTLEDMPAGKAAAAQVCGRLLDLRRRKASGKDCYPKRLQFVIQDVLDMRAAGRTKKLFRNTAKTKEDIRMEQELGIAEDGFSCVVAGARPASVVGPK